MRGLSNDFLKKFIRKYNFSNSEHFVKSGVGKLQNERGCAMINECKGICCEGIEQSYAKQ